MVSAGRWPVGLIVYGDFIMTFSRFLNITFLFVMALLICLDPPLASGQEMNSFCKGPPLAGGISSDEIIIGQWGPESGPAASWGTIARGTAFYFDMINAEGGIHGRRIRHLVFDDHYNPQRTLSGLKELVEGCGVFALVGGVGTEPCLAAADHIISQGIPWVGPVSGADALVNPPKKNIFGLWPRAGNQAKALVIYGYKYLNKKKYAVIYQNDRWGENALVGAIEGLGRFGLAPLVQIALEIAELDMKDEIARLKAAGIEAVIIWVNPTHAILLRQEAMRQDFKPVWMTGALLSDSQRMNRMTGRNWQGTIYATMAEPPDSKFHLMQNYRRYFDRHGAHGQKWGPFFYLGIGLAEPLVEALHHCGPEVTREKLIYHLENLNHYEGILGKISFGPNNRRGQPRFYLAEAGPNGQPVRLTDWIE